MYLCCVLYHHIADYIEGDHCKIAYSKEVHKEYLYFSMKETVWRLTSHKDTAGTDLLQHHHPHNVVLTMEPSHHHYSDYHHCRVFHPVTIYVQMVDNNIVAVYSSQDANS